MKSNEKKSKVIMIITGLFFVATCFLVGATYAKYSSAASGNTSARVAKFNFALNGAGPGTSTQTLTINDLFKNSYLSGKVTGASSAKVVAPGTSGYVEVQLSNTGEVAIVPSWTITETNASNIPLQYQISTTTTADNSKWAAASSLAPSTSAVAIGGNQKYYIHWRWNPSSTDAADTALGIAGTATVNIKLDCTVSQQL